ncbi:MAG: hypothetical protein GY909_17925 [Oligoflexia bacterium]|nr:hypothetical protein [Oligoflexia bacterium]
MSEETKENNEMTYINSDGDTVFTSTYLKKRGTCCKTNCLHCPYGFTQKNYSIELEEIELKHIQIANEIITDSNPVELSAVSMSLLESAFGKNTRVKNQHVTMDNLSNFAFGKFKGVICSVVEFSNRLSESAAGRPIKEIFLKKEFQEQDLGIEHIKQ